MTKSTVFLIAYGSHTGQAESIAKQIKERSEILGLTPHLYCLEETEKKFFLEKESLAVIVISSTGDGDPPENSARFMRRISRKTLDGNFLSGLNYALMGLGDSNYSTYQGVPKKLDKELERLGAKRIISTGAADDQVGLELEVEPWCERLFVELCKRFEIPEENLKMLNSDNAKNNGAVIPPTPDNTTFETTITAPEIPMIDVEPYDYTGDTSLIQGSPALSADEALRVPIAPTQYLVSSVNHERGKLSNFKWQNGCNLVGAHSELFDATVVSTSLLTQPSAVKPKREIVIDLGENADKLRFEPGDAFYFIQPNPAQEVNFILKRMGVLEIADQKCTVSVSVDSKKPNASVPGYVPPVSSLRYIFTHCLDIRRAPGRPILRVFAESTNIESEKRRLLELCSAQGMNEFTQHVRQAALSIVDVLLAFPGVRPSPDRLIEQLPRITPRPFSVSNCFERARGRIRFVYSQMTFTATEGRRYIRKGLASAWLESLKVGDILQVILKEPARFRLPPPPLTWNDAVEMPLLMIGPGTGVSTFLSFMDKLLHHKITSGVLSNIERLMFFGCRNIDIDFIYRDELEQMVREGVLSSLVVCESQKEDGLREKYVQDALKKRGDKVIKFLSLPNSRVFICGDGKGMSKDVWACFLEIVQENMGMTAPEATNFLQDLKKADRYIEDVWA